MLGKADNKIPITVSITTYPARVKWLPVVIGSLVRQTRQPDRVVLYLSRQQFHNLDSPVFKRIQEQGIQIVLCDDDLRSHKKYLYAMQSFPNDIIITVDDDVLYDKNMIEDLYQSYLKHPGAVSAKRVHKMVFDAQGRVRPYCKWDISTRDLINVESKELIATGCGGILYPPCCLDQRYNDVDLIKRSCMFADDIWLKIMELLAGTPVVLAQSKSYRLDLIWDTENNGLALDNVGGAGNDQQLNRICKELEVDLYQLLDQK